MDGETIIKINEEFYAAVRASNMAAPGRIARLAAMVNIAMFDAVNLLANLPNAPLYHSYTRNLPDPADYPGARPKESAEFAGRKVLRIGLRMAIEETLASPNQADDPLGLYSIAPEFDLEEFFVALERKAKLDEAEEEPADADDKAAKQRVEILNASQSFGEAVADAIIEERRTDGSANADAAPDVPFGFSAGDWRPTGSGAPVTPRWGEVRSFSRWDDIDRFLPTVLIPGDLPRGCDLDGDDYARVLSNPRYTYDFEEVRELGGATSRKRTQEQTRIAFFWANDVDRTYKTPGQLLQITQIVARGQGTVNNLLQTARLFALVGIALADASIVGWYVKYLFPEDDDRNDIFRLWRPETAIRMANSDCRPETRPESGWQPLSIDRMGRRFSPAFPAFISGHAVFGAAHGAVMRLFYGRDDIVFTARTEDPNALALGAGARRFESFTEAAIENAVSRIYLGVHYRIDAIGGYESGTRIGIFTFGNVLRPRS